MKKKVLICVVAVVLVLCCAVGGTIAWLTAKTDSVTNTFTVGDINITLTETERDYKMVPGNELKKDPKVTVTANSEACWLFVKVEASANLSEFVSYQIAEGWTELESGVYYREVDAATAKAGVSFDVLQGNAVTVKENVTKQQMNDLTQATYPTLTFTAYAVQKDNVATAADAWAKVNP